MKKPTTILQQLIEAKEAENLATQKRINLENEVYECFKSDLKKTAGQETIEQLGFKIIINQPLTWKLNEESYRKLCKTLPESFQCHSTKISLDKKKYDAVLSVADKKTAEKIQNCVSATPGKVAVSVEKLSQQKPREKIINWRK